MSKYRNIPQATKDNVLHYVNQVYDEAYELGYQRGRLQSDRDIKNAQQMIEDTIKNLRELKQEPTSYAVKLVRCRECEYWKCNPNTNNYGVCGKVSYDDFEVIMERDDFCSYGTCIK